MKKAILLISMLMLALPAGAAPLAKATFAGGCFWCMEPPYEKLPGVVSVVSGYTGGAKKNPTYEEVSAGGTGHREVVEITYDPARVTYAKLLEVFWHNIDPLDGAGQFCDKGFHYTAAIYVHDAEQRRLAIASRDGVKRRFPNLVTEIVAAAPFYRAEEYHQDYYKKNPIRYRYYRGGCGRDRRLEQLWGADAGK